MALHKMWMAVCLVCSLSFPFWVVSRQVEQLRCSPRWGWVVFSFFFFLFQPLNFLGSYRLCWFLKRLCIWEGFSSSTPLCHCTSPVTHQWTLVVTAFEQTRSVLEELLEKGGGLIVLSCCSSQLLYLSFCLPCT